MTFVIGKLRIFQNYIMKKVLLIAITCLLPSSLFAQDSIVNPKMFLRPYIENGVDFIRNDELKQNYNTQSKYFVGLGLQFGHPMTSKMIPYMQLSYSKCSINKLPIDNIDQPVLDDTFQNEVVTTPIITEYS